MTGSVTPWQVRPDGLDLRVRATPRGGRDGIDGIEIRADGLAVLKVRVRAPPEDGAANAAIRAVLRRALGCPAAAVQLTGGGAARVKTFRIAGDGPDLARRLAAATGG
ncbi:MAG: DUF167 family protein [Methylobacterium frigidaeris]